jgi:hypothetical protein
LPPVLPSFFFEVLSKSLAAIRLGLKHKAQMSAQLENVLACCCLIRCIESYLREMRLPRNYKVAAGKCLQRLLAGLSADDADNARMKWLIGFCVALLLFSGCSGQLYRVAPAPKAPVPVSPDETKDSPLAARLLTGDELLEQFDANLLLAGVVVIDARIANRTVVGQTVAFALQDAAGASLKPLSPKQALQRVMKFYGNLLFAKAAYANTLAQYEALAFPLSFTLEPQAERRGFLYFTSTTAATKGGLRLTAAGASINLN